MSDPEDVYGLNIPILDKLKLLAEWAPLIGRLQAVAAAETPEGQALAIIKTLQWMAGKSANEIDDEALYHLEAVLKSAEGKEFFNWVVAKVSGAK